MEQDFDEEPWREQLGCLIRASVALIDTDAKQSALDANQSDWDFRPPPKKGGQQIEQAIKAVLDHAARHPDPNTLLTLLKGRRDWLCVAHYGTVAARLCQTQENVLTAHPDEAPAFLKILFNLNCSPTLYAQACAEAIRQATQGLLAIFETDKSAENLFNIVDFLLYARVPDDASEVVRLVQVIPSLSLDECVSFAVLVNQGEDGSRLLTALHMASLERIAEEVSRCGRLPKFKKDPRDLHLKKLIEIANATSDREEIATSFNSAVEAAMGIRTRLQSMGATGELDWVPSPSFDPSGLSMDEYIVARANGAAGAILGSDAAKNLRARLLAQQRKVSRFAQCV